MFSLVTAIPLALLSAAAAEAPEPPAERVPVRVVLVDRMGDLFRLHDARAWLDGRPVEVGQVTAEDRQVLLEGTLPAGHHELVVDIVYAGVGGPVTTYFDEYRFHVRRPISFDAGEGGAEVTLVIEETEGFFTELSQKASLAYKVTPLRAP